MLAPRLLATVFSNCPLVKPKPTWISRYLTARLALEQQPKLLWAWLSLSGLQRGAKNGTRHPEKTGHSSVVPSFLEKGKAVGVSKKSSTPGKNKKLTQRRWQNNVSKKRKKKGPIGWEKTIPLRASIFYAVSLRDKWQKPNLLCHVTTHVPRLPRSTRRRSLHMITDSK